MFQSTMNEFFSIHFSQLNVRQTDRHWQTDRQTDRHIISSFVCLQISSKTKKILFNWGNWWGRILWNKKWETMKSEKKNKNFELPILTSPVNLSDIANWLRWMIKDRQTFNFGTNVIDFIYKRSFNKILTFFTGFLSF